MSIGTLKVLITRKKKKIRKRNSSSCKSKFESKINKTSSVLWELRYYLSVKGTYNLFSKFGHF